MKRRIGLECQYMALLDAFERGSRGDLPERGGVHGYDDVVLLTLQTLPDTEKLRRRLSPLFTLQVSTYRRPVLHGEQRCVEVRRPFLACAQTHAAVSPL